MTGSRLLQANEMLLFNKKLTAAQACDLGLVTEVFPDSSFQAEVWSRLKGYGELPPNVSKHTCGRLLLTPAATLAAVQASQGRVKERHILFTMAASWTRASLI